MKYYIRPCGIYFGGDPSVDCHFYNHDMEVCTVGIEDPEGEDPCSLRFKELEEFEIMEEHQDLDYNERELIASKMHKCYLHITNDEIIDAIQIYRSRGY